MAIVINAPPPNSARRPTSTTSGTLSCRHMTHQPGQVGADFHQFGIRHFQHQFVMHLQDEAGLQS